MSRSRQARGQTPSIAARSSPPPWRKPRRYGKQKADSGLERALHVDPPKLFNSDDDEILFHRVNFPLAKAAASADAIAARLDQLADLRRASATFWNWLGDRAASSVRRRSQKA